MKLFAHTGRAVFLLTALSLLGSCGFKPLYGREERAANAVQIESVQIVTDNGRLPQLLKAEIEDQVNPDSRHAEKLFVMTIKFSEVEISLFINPDGTSSRGDMQYTSAYTLTRKLDGKLIDKGTLTRISSYNISETADFATFVSREDARKRGILELAQDYKLRIANLLPKINDPNAKPVEPTGPAPTPLIQVPDNHENRPTGD